MREIVHLPTGAHVMHLGNDDPENLFCLSFKTLPSSSNGAAHMLNPEKLIGSAARIYGTMMDQLWGEFLPVPAEALIAHHDNEELAIEGLHFCTLDTPGHADHHFAYLFEDTLFTGDVGGVRLPGPLHVRVPMPPPEFHLEKWRNSLKRLRAARPQRLAPTHFGIYDDAERHFAALERGLDEVEAFMREVLPADPPVPVISDRFMAWTEARSLEQGVPHEALPPYEAANPSWMSATGMQRYWKKYRVNESATKRISESG